MELPEMVPWRLRLVTDSRRDRFAWDVMMGRGPGSRRLFSLPRETPEEAALLIASVPAFVAACRAALAYDAAIQRQATADPASNWIQDSGELDRLYEDWITKARAALAAAGQGHEPPER